MNSHVVNSGIDCICYKPCAWTGSHSFPEKIKDGTDGACGGCTVSFEEGRNTDNGGIIILAAVVITSLFYVKDYPKIIPVLFLTVGFGLIGFLDDYLKVVMKRSDGLFPMQKMALQIVVTAIFAFYIVKVAKIPLTMIVPFSGGYELNLGWLAIPVLFLQ